jgi:hypothetical protein
VDPAVLVERNTEPNLGAGAELLKALDKRDLQVNAALWRLDEDSREWRLLIASPRVEKPGPTWFLKHIQDALKKAGSGLRLRDIEVHSPRDPEIALFRGVLSTGGKGAQVVRFARNIIKGTFVEDAYIYRLP